MAVVKDPTKTIIPPTTVPARDAKGSKGTDPAPIKRRDDFDFSLDNLMRQLDARNEQHEHDAEARDEDFERFKKQITGENNSLGFESLFGKALTDLDIFKADTTNPAVRDMQIGIITNKDNSQRIYLSGAALDNFLVNSAASGNTESRRYFTRATVGSAQRDLNDRYVGQVVAVEPGKLNPDLAARMSKNPELAKLVNYAVSRGNANGIDGTMYANQLWQESRFNPRAQSGAGAMGVAQMMPFQQGKFGLHSREDFFDPYKSIDAGAQMMSGLTKRYGDQRLALVAYNGGEGALDFVKTKLGKSQVSFQEWYGFMDNRRETLGTANKSAWHVETLHYTEVIAGAAADRAIAKASAPAAKADVRKADASGPAPVLS